MSKIKHGLGVSVSNEMSTPSIISIKKPPKYSFGGFLIILN